MFYTLLRFLFHPSRREECLLHLHKRKLEELSELRLLNIRFHGLFCSRFQLEMFVQKSFKSFLLKQIKIHESVSEKVLQDLPLWLIPLKYQYVARVLSWASSRIIAEYLLSRGSVITSRSNILSVIYFKRVFSEVQSSNLVGFPLLDPVLHPILQQHFEQH